MNPSKSQRLAYPDMLATDHTRVFDREAEVQDRRFIEAPSCGKLYALSGDLVFDVRSIILTDMVNSVTVTSTAFRTQCRRMGVLLSEILTWLACRWRGRAALKLEIIAVLHQLAVLRRRHPGRVRLFAIDRFIWVWLYRVRPRCHELIAYDHGPLAPAGVRLF